MYKTVITRRSCLSMVGAALGASVLPASAQADWPTRQITIIVPSAASGAADFVARLFAQYLTPKLKQPVIVENRPGAATVMGADALARAPADGYTFLLSGTSTEAANPSLFTKLPYDPEKDFVEIGLFGLFPMVGLVKPGSPLKSVADIIAQGKSGKLSYGYYSATSQVPPELIRESTGIEILPVPYKSIAQIQIDLAGGVIDFAFLDALSAAPSLKGLLTPIAVTSPERDPNLPAIPAVAETLSGFDVQTFSGLTARTGTPAAVIARMGEYVRAATADPAIREALMKQGMTVRQSSPEEQTAFVAVERKRWKEFVRIAKIQPQ